MNRLRRPSRFVLLCAATTAGVVTSLAATYSLSAADTEQPPPTAVEVGRQISDMTAAGVPPDSPKIKMLEGVRTEILAADPTATEPGPYDEVHGWPLQGEIECDALPGITDAYDLTGSRCVSIPRGGDARLFVFVTPRGQALAVNLNTSVKTSGSMHLIPEFSQLTTADISVRDDGAIVVQIGSRALVIDTNDW